jgi:hypothetical protein
MRRKIYIQEARGEKTAHSICMIRYGMVYMGQVRRWDGRFHDIGVYALALG